MLQHIFKIFVNEELVVMIITITQMETMMTVLMATASMVETPDQTPLVLLLLFVFDLVRVLSHRSPRSRTIHTQDPGNRSVVTPIVMLIMSMAMISPARPQLGDLHYHLPTYLLTYVLTS